MSASAFLPEEGTVTMFTTSWCGYCKRLKPQLASADISVNEVNIEEVEGAAGVVEEVNAGNQTVPTLLYSDGSAQTNPSLAQVKERLATLA